MSRYHRPYESIRLFVALESGSKLDDACRPAFGKGVPASDACAFIRTKRLSSFDAGADWACLLRPQEQEFDQSATGVFAVLATRILEDFLA